MEDKSESVRAATVKNLGVLCAFIAGDAAKFAQLRQLLMQALRDPSESVRQQAQQVLLPAVAELGHVLGLLQTNLVADFLSQLTAFVKVRGRGRHRCCVPTR